jgi:hypothetical protein
MEGRSDNEELEKTMANMTMHLIGEEEIIACYLPTTSNNNALNASGQTDRKIIYYV